MRSLKALTLIGIAAMIAAPAHAYERCKSLENAELKAMSAEGLEKAYCWNEDRLMEILAAVRLSRSEEAERDRDACWETLIKLSAQPEFVRQGNCPSTIEAAVSTGREATPQTKKDLWRNLGIATGKEGPAR